MPRTKRVSIKGRGSDLFFGDGVPSLAEQAATNPQDEQASKQALLQASVGAGKQASIIASKQARGSSKPIDQPTNPNPVVDASLAYLWNSLDSRATVANTFRFTEDELSRLEDVIYALTKNRRSKFSRQDVIRLGLNLALWDYEAHGHASLLAQAAAKRK